MTEKKSREIQWAVWANETSLLGAATLFVGGIIGIVGGLLFPNFLLWLPISIYGTVSGLALFLFEYPRGKKLKGKSVPREYQASLTNFVSFLRFLKYYYVRSILYLFVSLPAIVVVPTLLGAVSILAGSIIYFGAAIHGENWEPIVEKSVEDNAQKQIGTAPPSQPPPRLPQQLPKQ